MRLDPRGRLRAYCLALACAACSGSEFSLGDGRSQPDAAAEDAQVPTPDGQLSFSEPTPLESLRSEDDEDDDDPSLTADRTLLYFNSNRAGGAGKEDIWYSARTGISAAWEAPSPALELNTEARETGIALAPDGLTIWFSSDRDDGSGGLDVYTAARVRRDATWSPPARVAELSAEHDDLVSAIGQDALTLYLARRPGEDDDYDLYVARRADASAPWQAPEPIDELNSDDEESDAFACAGGRLLLFTRDEDLQLAQRASPSGAFQRWDALERLNTDADDRDAWASEDLAYIVFSSDRDGSYRLYEAFR